MTDLRKAAQKLVDKWDNFHGSRNPSLFPTTKELIEALRQALAQQEQEPVAIISKNKASIVGIKMPYSNIGTDDWIKLYTAPPKREWVGLTDDEIAILDERYHRDNWKLIKEAETKLKEKNT